MNSGRKGFTLIEILIVVAIIAILASVVLIGLGPTQQAGRDARRLSDLRQVQNGLELYFNRCGYYPGTTLASPCPLPSAHNSWAEMTTALTTSNIGVSAVPNDPQAGKNYFYSANSAAGTNAYSSYIIGATLENAQNSVFNTYQPPVFTAGDYVGGLTCAGPNYCISL
jgi:prepilin-type N-terminal cleavage/methylation domain-containing protein